MDITGVLGCLNEAGIRLSARDGQLQVSAPKGAMTAELKALLGQHKAALLQLLEHGAQQRAAAGLVPVPREGRLPLSLAQQRLWFLEQLEGASTVYNKLVPLRLEGELDVAALRQAVAGIVQRHEALRCRFLAAGGEPFVEVVDALELPIAVREIRAEALDAEIVREAARPFALDCAPLLRVSLLRLAPRTHVLLLSIHHVVSDGWSMGVLVQEFGALYAACRSGQPSPLAPLPVQYIDYAAWQRQWLQGEELQRQLGFWRTQLAELPPLLELPTDRPRPALQGHAGQTLHFALPAGLGESLQALARRENVSLFMLLLAVFKVLLARYTGQGDIVVGTPVANREHAELEGLIGFFANTLVLRDRVEPAQPFNAFLADLKERTLAAYRHQSVSFEQLVEELQPARSMSYSPLIQVLFALQNAPLGEIALPGLQASLLGQASGTAKYDLTLELEESASGLRGSLEYKAELFEAATIARLRDHFVALLAAVVATPARPLGQLPLLGAAEREQLLVEWNDTAATFGAAGWVHTQVEAQAAHSPTATALVFEGVSMDYATLNARANRLAHYLRAQGVGPDVIVGVSQERSFELVISLLAVMKAGGAYLPVDPEYPAERIGYLLQDAQPRLLLTTVALQPRLPATTLPQVCVDRDAAQWHALSAANPAVALQPDHLIYVFYTSGSTGKPKGTMNTHGAVRNRLCWMQQEVPVQPGERVLQKTPFSFDISVCEMFWPLMHGGTLVLARPGGHGDPAYLRQLIASEGISTAHFVPSMLQVFLNEPGVAELTGLRRTVSGGEALPQALAQRLFETLPRVEAIHNLYGPTEAAIEVSAWRCTAANVHDGVRIGHPIANLRLYVLDTEMQPVPVGVAGELYIGGIGLARGYLGRPDLTAEKFVPDPFDPAGARLYCTGDSVRLRADGAIEYLQRLDHQVKVRGFRIELGEIEAVLRARAGVREAVVMAVADSHGDTRLVAYVAASADLDIDHLRDELQQHLPEYMVPSNFMRLDALPLSSNGKLDRKALPAADLALQSRAPYAAPGTATETELVAIWAAVLHRDTSIGIHDNFFEIGGHSLLATQVVSRIREAIGVEMEVRRLFDLPTVAALAQWLDGCATGPAGPQLLPVSRDRPIPLSFAQQRVWFLHQLEGPSATYNIPVAIDLRGTLDAPALQLALQDIVHRHEALRTSFAEHDGMTVQRVHPPMPLPMPLLEVSASALPQHIERDAAEPFDLATAPLFRARLLRLDDTHHVLLLNMHHIVSDGYSFGVLVEEISQGYRARLYGAPADRPPLTVQYGDFAHWQRERLQGAALQAEVEHWQQALEGLPTLLPLPTDRVRPAVQSYRGAVHRVNLPRTLCDRLQMLSQRQGVTLYMTLLATFNVLLARYAGVDDIAVGTSIANRNRPELEALIGFFVNTLIVRTRIDESQTFVELLQQVRDSVLDVYAHQDLPFEQLVEALQPVRSMSHSPWFQVMLVLQNTPMDTLELPQLELSIRDPHIAVAKYDLSLYLTETPEGLRADLEYSTDLFDEATMVTLLGHYRTLLEGVVAAPGQRIDRLSMIAPPEREQLLGWATPAPVADASLAHPCLHRLFEARASEQPDAVAVREGSRTISYAALDTAANQLAHRLLAGGLAPETPVGLLMERSIGMAIGFLGILKAGAAYVPFNPALPDSRIETMLGDIALGCMVTTRALVSRVPAVVPDTVLVDEASALAVQPTHAPEVGASVRAGQLAYVIFTSGSTGKPKGVLVEHGSIASNFRAWDTLYRLSRDTRKHLQMAGIGFDVCIGDMTRALCSGGELVICAKETLLDPAALAHAIHSHRIDFAEFVPVVLRHLVAHLQHEHQQLAPLKFLVTGSDVWYVEDLLNTHRVVSSGTQVINSYGLTEAAVDSTCFLTGLDAGLSGGAVPIGGPLANVWAYVLDPAMGLSPRGVPGELYIGGPTLARGYLHAPQTTAARFVPDPFGAPGSRLYRTGDLARWRGDGSLELLGRADYQVKIRGFRIELGEVEQVLRSLPGIHDTVVLALPRPGGLSLAAYVVAEPAAGYDARVLRERLQAHLPDYMVPAAFVLLDALPQSSNGKIDRKALPAPDFSDQQRAGQVAPRSDDEARLCAIWSEVLGVDTIGIHDNFFEIGGHSLLATQVVSRMRQAFDVAMPVRQLFDSPTVAELALWVEAQGRQSAGPALVAVPRTAPLPLSFAQQRLWFIDQLEGAHAAYNMPAALRLSGTLDVAALRASIQAIVDRHETLRTCFATVAGEPVQQIAAQRTIEVPLVEVEEAALMARAQAFAEAPFDLARGPLLRAELLRLGPGEHVLLTNMHHIISDGWSVGVLVGEFVALYRARVEGAVAALPALPALPVQYADFAQWQRQCLQGETLQRQQDYWKTQLAELPPLLTLPTDRPRPAVQGTAGGSHAFVLPAALTQALKALGQARGATLFMTLLAAFKVLLARYAGQADIAVGTPIANRTRPELDGLIGFFVNTLVLRTQVRPEQSFETLLDEVRTTALAAYEHQDLPFEQLVEFLNPERSLSHSPLFQVMFVLQNNARHEHALPGLAVSLVEPEERLAQFDLTLELEETGDASLSGRLSYRTELFEPATIARLAGHFTHLLGAIAAAPAAVLGGLPMLSEAEQSGLLHDINGAPVRYAADRCMHGVFEARALAAPDATAVRFEGDSLSYAELNTQANRLAHYLRARGVGPDVIVGICLERSATLVVALLAVLKAGGAYLPIDPDCPRERFAYLLEDAAPALIVTEESLRDRIPAGGFDLVTLDRDHAGWASAGTDNPTGGAQPAHLAYVIYTSGSTGRPKGVLVEHRQAVRLFAATHDWFDFRTDDVWTLFHSCAFDFSVWELWGALLHGACLVVVPYWVSRSPEDFHELLCKERVTFLNQTPTAFRSLLRADAESAQRLHVRCVALGGEALDLHSLEPWFDRYGDQAQLTNLYGITETAVVVSGHRVTRADVESERGSVIGRPMADLPVYVLDSHGQLAPAGVPGELHVGGAGLARGYLNRPELTAERFIAGAALDGVDGGTRWYRTGDLVRTLVDGELEYLGRIDAQVKIRGFRIELGEVESALAELPAVHDVTVQVVTDADGDKRLVAYVVAGDGLDPDSLRGALGAQLPDYMVPSYFVMLEALPLTSNGKVDASALPPVDPAAQRRNHYVAAGSDTEVGLVAIWVEVLKRDAPIGIHDNFFEVGGHSLLGTQVAARVRQQWNVELPLRRLFETPTIHEMAAFIEMSQAMTADDEVAGTPLQADHEEFEV